MILWLQESKRNFHISPSQWFPQHCYDWLSNACLLNHRRLHSVGSSNSAVEQKSWDRPRMELEAIKQVFTVISFHTAGTWRTFCHSDFRLMTSCRLTGTQVSGIKFNIRYGQGTLQGLWLVETIWFVEIQGCLSQLKYWLSKVILCYFGYVLFKAIWHGTHGRMDTHQLGFVLQNMIPCTSNHPVPSVLCEVSPKLNTSRCHQKQKSVTEGITDEKLVKEKEHTASLWGD